MLNWLFSKPEFSKPSEVTPWAWPISTKEPQDCPNGEYTIGVDPEGRTVLTISSGTGTKMFLRLPPNECRKLIRLLEATLNPETDED